MSDKQITIIHPSRGRPQLAMNASMQWRQSAGMNVEYILSLDEDDHKNYTGIFLGNVIVNKNRSAVDAINNAAKVATGDILIVISDDWLLPQNWAVDILKASEGKTDWIMKTPDGIQKWMITLPILDRAYYNRFGYIYYPEFRHMFCDTFLTCVADLTGRRIEADIQFKHLHYSTKDGIPKDAVSVRADATWAQGEALFMELARKNYLLKPEEIKGQITDIGYLNWIKARL